jgi:HEPN domain
LIQSEWQRLSQEWITDAKALMEGGRWGTAYYLAGYAVECALKSCVLSRMIHTGWIFREDVESILECRTHDLIKLVEIAGMREYLNARLTASASAKDGFVENWDTVSAWTVISRYQPKPEADTTKLYAAITDEPHGVLKWIRNYW